MKSVSRPLKREIESNSRKSLEAAETKIKSEDDIESELCANFVVP